MQYPFSENEKVIIKVRFLQLVLLLSIFHDRFHLLDRYFKGNTELYRETGGRQKNMLGRKQSSHPSVSMAGEWAGPNFIHLYGTLCILIC